MNTQPEALRLADLLDAAPYSSPCTNNAAAELRRLHALNAELLEALQIIMGDGNHGQNMTWVERCQQARAVIAKATGEQT